MNIAYADTIVVGAGSSGAVIASRATERSEREILLVEAGPDYPDLGELPRDLRDGTRNSMWSHDWRFRHRPLPGQVIFDFPRGKLVGGSSAVNTCIAIRGQPYDYDEWAELGLSDWTWEKCLPAFKRIEDDRDIVNEWHGQGGPIPVRRHPRSELTPWQAAFTDACRALGFPACSDHNDPTQRGVGPHTMNKIDGVRQSAARGYLRAEVRARPNLKILGDTLVRRVLFTNGRVSGVEVERGGGVTTIGARRVFLCGGAIGTPGILLRSGVGPKERVERLGVELVADVPGVAARLLDHPGVAIFLVVPKPKSFVPTHLIQSLLRFTSEGSTYPNDMQLQAGSFVPLPRNLGVLPLVSIMSSVGKPRGHGKIFFESADPRHRPRIESDLLTHPRDRDCAAQAMELAWLCASSKEMREHAVFFWPGERLLHRRDWIRDFIVKSCDSGYHPCGTAPMGPDDDEEAVCDGRGRVRGAPGLFVADASAMPTIPSANTNFPTLMMGERFGEWVRDGEI